MAASCPTVWLGNRVLCFSVSESSADWIANQRRVPFFFIGLKDGEVAECGPYGVSAIDPMTGKILWRLEGAGWQAPI